LNYDVKFGCVLSGGPYLQTFTNVTSWWRHRPHWISNFYILSIYHSLGIFSVCFV